MSFVRSAVSAECGGGSNERRGNRARERQWLSLGRSNRFERIGVLFTSLWSAPTLSSRPTTGRSTSSSTRTGPERESWRERSARLCSSTGHQRRSCAPSLTASSGANAAPPLQEQSVSVLKDAPVLGPPARNPQRRHHRPLAARDPVVDGDVEDAEAGAGEPCDEDGGPAAVEVERVDRALVLQHLLQLVQRRAFAHAFLPPVCDDQPHLPACGVHTHRRARVAEGLEDLVRELRVDRLTLPPEKRARRDAVRRAAALEALLDARVPPLDAEPRVDEAEPRALRRDCRALEDQPSDGVGALARLRVPAGWHSEEARVHGDGEPVPRRQLANGRGHEAALGG